MPPPDVNTGARPTTARAARPKYCVSRKATEHEAFGWVRIPGTLLVVVDRVTSFLSGRDRRTAQVAHVLARAVRDGEMAAADALRILRHELRRHNTNRAQTIAARSTEAQRVIDDYGAANVPKDASLDALHADHVYTLTEDELYRDDTLELWINAMHRLRTVVCVTAEENYRLERCERRGITGPGKYAKAGVTFTTRELPWGKNQ